ncbi:MAG: hypothetical protein AAB518_00435 [Patescibacteria group bacterium]
MNSEEKTCQNCKKQFVIEPEDFRFYEKFKVPPPTFCPQCRLQRRQVWRNERTLYRRTCDLCKTSIVAMYPADAKFPVYCRSCWYSDKWDPLSYGRAYDFSKTFFSQFRELLDAVPRISLQIDNCVNCDYTNQIIDCKNCYLVFGAGWNEDCNYSYRIISSRKITDSFFIFKDEQCYETIESRDSALLYFSQDIADGLNLLFCYDTSGSDNCFMSSNLRRSSHYFRNKPLDKEEYAKSIAEIDTGSYKKLEGYKKEFADMYAKSIHRYANSKNVTNSTGHAFSNTKNAYYCFNGSDIENCRYLLFGSQAKDSMDVNIGDGMELCYENSTSGVEVYNIKFSSDTWPQVRNLEYCESCRGGASDLFGSIGIRGKQYCILNKQYPKEEYEALVPKIRKQMDEVPYVDAKGRIYKYGEFFPVEIAPFAYNETMAHDWFPLTEREVTGEGWRWKEEAERTAAIDISPSDLPDHIKDANESIVGKTIGCLHKGFCNQKCTVGFRIIPSEFQLYKTKNIALPRLCPNCRHYERMKRLTTYKLYRRQCACDYANHTNTRQHIHHTEGRCPNTFDTPYASDRKEIVYCETCYQAEVG